MKFYSVMQNISKWIFQWSYLRIFNKSIVPISIVSTDLYIKQMKLEFCFFFMVKSNRAVYIYFSG